MTVGGYTFRHPYHANLVVIRRPYYGDRILKTTNNMIVEIGIVLAAFGFVAEASYGQEWAGNIAGFSMWLLMVVCLFALVFSPADDLFKGSGKTPHVKYMYAVLVVIMVACGWLLTAFAMLLIYGSLWCKKQLWKEEQNDKTEDAA